MTELAFLHDRLSRGAVRADARGWEHDLVSAVYGARSRLGASYPQALATAGSSAGPPPRHHR